MNVALSTTSGVDRTVLSEESFHRMISLERKRTERSRKPFLLTLIDTGTCLPSEKNGKVLSKILCALSFATRETDVTGWYKTNSVVGVMFTEIVAEDKRSIVSTMLARVSRSLRNNLDSEEFSQISISFHLFPEDWDHEVSRRPSNPTLYPDLSTDAKKAEGFPRCHEEGHGHRGEHRWHCSFSPRYLQLSRSRSR